MLDTKKQSVRLTDILKAHWKCVLDKIYSISGKRHKQNQNNPMETTNSMKLDMTESGSIEMVAKLALKVLLLILFRPYIRTQTVAHQCLLWRRLLYCSSYRYSCYGCSTQAAVHKRLFFSLMYCGSCTAAPYSYAAVKEMLRRWSLLQ